MPTLKTYDIFISHAWKYGEDYDRLVRLLNNANNFSFRNYSAPSEKPLQNLNLSPAHTSQEILSAIERKIAPVNAVLVISGMYYNHREWMQKEIEIAQRYNKPIIAIRPWSMLSPTPKAISDASKTVVHWNTQSIVDAIREYSL